MLKNFAAVLLLIACLTAFGLCQNPSNDLEAKVDEAIAHAYQSAAIGFPCRLKSRGKPKMLRWQQVDRCLNDAASGVDWEALSRQLQNSRIGVRETSGIEFDAAVESSLSRHAISYDKIFSVSAKDVEALLPLTNSLLRFLPADSLQGLAVFDKSGIRVGVFSGTYTYERTGGLSAANSFQLIFFQYRDYSGSIQSASDQLLLDSYGVLWKDAATQKGFRLSLNKLISKP